MFKLGGFGYTSKRKSSKKLNFDEDKTSPVSGTIIRELADGEEIPVIRKGKYEFTTKVLYA